MSAILTLLWKEYRGNLHLIIVGLTVLLLPVLLAFSMTYANSDSNSLIQIIGVGLLFGTVASLVLSQGMLICLGGFLIGGERTARTFEFLFNQPVSRSKIVISKLVFALAWIVIVWLIGGGMLLIGQQLTESGRGFDLAALGINFFIDVGISGLMLFSACWLASNLIDGSILAMAVGTLAAAFLFFFTQVMTTRYGSVVTWGDVDGTRVVVFGSLSALFIVKGARLFVGRKSP